MDGFTQAALGAVVGHAVLGRRIGRKALLLGAMGGIAPDLDVFFADASSVRYWQVHRGISHSLFFGPSVGALLAGLCIAWQRWRSASPPTATVAANGPPGWAAWYAFWALVLVTHPMLDAMTVYGTQLLAPFSNRPFSWSVISIVDPVYTLCLVVGIGLALWRRAGSSRGLSSPLSSTHWALLLSSGYLVLCGSQNIVAERWIRAELARSAQALPAAAAAAAGASVHVYTTIFSPWLHRVVVSDTKALRVTFVSTWSPRPLQWFELPRDAAAEALATAALQTPEGRIFARFAEGPRLARLVDAPRGAELRISDARFGFPGPQLPGLWGLAVPLNADGQMAGTPYRYDESDTPPEAGSLNALWCAKVGCAQSLF
jgi:inner membrane protein